MHMQIEENLVYPLVAERVGEDEEREAKPSARSPRDGLAKMNELVDEGGFGAAVAMVTAGIKHHVKEEEDRTFPRAEGQPRARRTREARRRSGQCQDGRRCVMPTRAANVKNKKQYEALKEKGHVQGTCREIANSPQAS